MAKLFNGLLGNSKNKIGSIVTYVMKGQQLARSKAANVSNPRTAAQMTQRIKLANVVAMYRTNKAWMSRYAFANKLTKWSVFNAFVHHNLSTSLVALTKQEAAAGACVVAPYKMTDGYLSEITVNEDAGGTYKTNLYLGDLVFSASTTIADLSAALIANNNGIVEGMQLSLIENFQTDVNGTPKVIVRAYEMIISTSNTDPVVSRIPSAGLVQTDNALAYDPSAENAAQAFTFILSQTVGGNTDVSPSTMVLVDAGTYNSYCEDAAVAAAIASYGSTGETPFLDSTVADSAAISTEITPAILYLKKGAAGTNVTSGGYFGTVSTADNLIATLNVNTTGLSITAARVNVDDGTGNDVYVNCTIGTLGTNTVSLVVGTVTGSPKLMELEITIDGVAYTIAFVTTDSGITE